MQAYRTAVLSLALAVLGPSVVRGQESASFRLNEHAVNAGGVPAQGDIHASASFRLTLESIAGPVAHPRSQSKGLGVSGGFVPGHAPATEVQGLRFADGDTLAWNGHPAAGTFRVYRDALADVGLALGHCLEQDLAAPTADDPTDPAPGAGFAYLVTVANTLGEEGPPGNASGGIPRALVTPCP